MEADLWKPLLKECMSKERNIYRKTWNSKLRHDTGKVWESWRSLITKGQTGFCSQEHQCISFIATYRLKNKTYQLIHKRKTKTVAFNRMGRGGGHKVRPLNTDHISFIPEAAVRLDFSTADSSCLVEPSGESVASVVSTRRVWAEVDLADLAT